MMLKSTSSNHLRTRSMSGPNVSLAQDQILLNTAPTVSPKARIRSPRVVMSSTPRLI